MEKLLDRFSRISKPAIIGASLLCVAFTGWLDVRLDSMIGFELSLFPLYWLALCPVTWYCGAPWGYAMGALSVALVTVGDLVSNPSWIHQIPFWGNFAMRLAAFAMFIWMLSKLRAVYDRESQLRGESQAVATLKSDLMSLMSHEINNAIAVLKMTAFLMQEDEIEPTPRRKEGYEIFGRVLLNIELATRNFLDQARMQAGRLSLNLEPVALGKRIEETVSVFSPILEQRSLTVIAHIPRDLPDVLVDRAALMLILSNLFGNAVKYTSNKGRITVKVEPDARQRSSLRVSISDTGIGIGPSDRERIFDGFVRLPEGKVMAKGFGLGLKTVYDLLKLHGTHLDLESEVGRGSTFSFSLPIAEKVKAP